jgi:hypothetical protein
MQTERGHPRPRVLRALLVRLGIRQLRAHGSVPWRSLGDVSPPAQWTVGRGRPRSDLLLGSG